MPPAVRSAPVYSRPVYTAIEPVRTQPSYQAPLITNSVSTVTPQPVYSQPMPPMAQAPVKVAAVSVPVDTVPVNTVPVARAPVVRAPVSVPVKAQPVDYTSSQPVRPNLISGPPVVISRFETMPKAGPRGKQTYMRTYQSQPVVAQRRQPVTVPVAAQPLPPKPEKSRFSIARFFALPKASPKPKNVDYRATASIQPPVAIQPDPALNGNQFVNGRTFAARTSGQWTSVGGSMITAMPGDNIQALSHRYGVPAKAIAEVNGLPDKSFVASGQKLIIPVYQQAQLQPVVPAQPMPPLQPKWQQTASLAPVFSPAPSLMGLPKSNPLRLQAKSPYARNISRHQKMANAQNRHMVMPGDTLNSIASRYRVSTQHLAQANGINVTSRIRMGQRLVIPAQQQIDYTTTASIDRRTSVQMPIMTAVQAGSMQQSQPTQSLLRLTKLPKVKPRASVEHTKLQVPSFNAKAVSLPKAKAKVTRQKVAALQKPVGLPTNIQSDASPAKPAQPIMTDKASNAPQFRWPVRGRIISSYGRKRDGGRNDGINLAVPAGTSVRVAESERSSMPVMN